MNRAIHIILTFLLLIGSTGLVINKHYCRQQLKSTAFFLKAEACHQNSKQPSCPMHAAADDHNGHGERKDCCDDQTEYLKAEVEQLLTASDFYLHLPTNPVALSVWSSIAKRTSLDRLTLHYLNYKPPLIVCDRQVLLQTFLC